MCKITKLSPLILPLSPANGGEGGVRGKDKKANSYTIKLFSVFSAGSARYIFLVAAMPHWVLCGG